MDSDIEVTASIDVSLEENLPAGMRFVPTDSEIIGYLKSYNRDEPALPTYIHQVVLSDHHPRDLMRIYGKQRTSERLIISQRYKKYVGGHRPCRDGADGFYKPTSKDNVIVDEDGEPAGGVFKTLAYYEGKFRPSANKSHWMIKEYRLGDAGEKGRDNHSDLDPVTLDGFVLCKLYESTRRKRKGGAIEEHQHIQSHETDWQSREHVNHAGSFDETSNPKPYDNLWRPYVNYGSKIHHHDYSSLVPLDMIRPMNIVPGCQSQSSVDLDPMFGFQGSMTLSLQQHQEPYVGNANSFEVNQEGGVLDSERSCCQAANLLGVAFNPSSEMYFDGQSHMNTNKAENYNGIEARTQ